jgi:hypothetical protein
MTEPDMRNRVKTPPLNFRLFLEKVCFVGRVGQEGGEVVPGLNHNLYSALKKFFNPQRTNGPGRR